MKIYILSFEFRILQFILLGPGCLSDGIVGPHYGLVWVHFGRISIFGCLSKKSFVSQTRQQNFIRCRVVTIKEVAVAPVSAVMVQVENIMKNLSTTLHGDANI